MYLNIILQTIQRSGDDLAELDPYGAGLAIISITIVFSVLITLYFVFKIIGNTFKRNFKFSKLKKTKTELDSLKIKEEPSGEVCAAIAMAIYYYNSQNHDYEYTILTIKKKMNTYSPWNSKIYGLRKTAK